MYAVVPNGRFGDTGTTPLVSDFTSAVACIFSKVKQGESGAALYEPNGMNSLFSSSQPWTVDDARKLILAAWSYYELDKA